MIEILSEKQLKQLNKGLIKTYPIESLELRFKNIFNDDSLDFNFAPFEDNIYTCHVEANNREIIPVEKLLAAKSALTVCGYFIAKIEVFYKNKHNKYKFILFDSLLEDIKHNKYEVEWIAFQIEPKFQSKAPNYPYLYHVTLDSKVQSILEQGLVPKNYNKQTFHPERVYFATTLSDAEEILEYFSGVEKKNKVPVTKKTILKVKMTGEEEIYIDPQFSGGVFVLEAILPSQITKVKTI